VLPGVTGIIPGPAGGGNVPPGVIPRPARGRKGSAGVLPRVSGTILGLVVGGNVPPGLTPGAAGCRAGPPGALPGMTGKPWGPVGVWNAPPGLPPGGTPGALVSPVAPGVVPAVSNVVAPVPVAFPPVTVVLAGVTGSATPIDEVAVVTGGLFIAFIAFDGKMVSYIISARSGYKPEVPIAIGPAVPAVPPGAAPRSGPG
jgi:hypothetical protein